MKAKDLRQKNVAELREQIAKNHKDLYELRSKEASGQMATPHLMKSLKKDIARCLTLITEAERAGAGK